MDEPGNSVCSAPFTCVTAWTSVLSCPGHRCCRHLAFAPPPEHKYWAPLCGSGSWRPNSVVLSSRQQASAHLSPREKEPLTEQAPRGLGAPEAGEQPERPVALPGTAPHFLELVLNGAREGPPCLPREAEAVRELLGTQGVRFHMGPRLACSHACTHACREAHVARLSDKDTVSRAHGPSGLQGY